MRHQAVIRCAFFFSLPVAGLMFLQPLLAADYELPKNEEIALEGIRQMYNFDYAGAGASFERFTELNPEHPSGYFYSAVLKWLTGRMAREDKEIYPELTGRLDIVVSLAEDRLRKVPEDAFSMLVLGAAKGLKARIYVADKSWLKAFEDGYIGYSAIRDAMEMDTSLVDPLLGTGIFRYFVAISGPVIKSLAYVAGLRVSREEALAQLYDVARRGKYASIEGRSFLMFAYAYIEGDVEKALPLAKGLVEEFRRNPYFRGKYADILLMDGRVEEAQTHIEIIPELLDGVPEKYAKEMKVRATYLRAESLRRRGRLEESLKLLLSIENEYNLEFDFNLGFMYLRIGMIYDESGERARAIVYYKKTEKLDNYTTAIKSAKDFLKAPYTGETARLGQR